MSESANTQWLRALRAIADPENCNYVAPRGKETIEVRGTMITIEMQLPVVSVPERKLSTAFLAGEAYWILSGSDKVDEIAPYNKHISQFSDNGETFFGAYGPPLREQLPYIIQTLLRDQDTRQAVLTLWRQSPPKSKDIPCTLAMIFHLRGNELHMTVYMRSSDVWLGLPYDLFNFSMIGLMVTYLLNQGRNPEKLIQPGNLSVGSASLHLYMENIKGAYQVMTKYMDPSDPTLVTLPVPKTFWAPMTQTTPVDIGSDVWVDKVIRTSPLMMHLDNLRRDPVNKKARWWEGNLMKAFLQHIGLAKPPTDEAAAAGEVH